MEDFFFSPRERDIVYRLGRAIIPQGKRFGPFDWTQVDRLEMYLRKSTPLVRKTVQGVLWTVEETARARHALPMSDLPTEKIAAWAEGWMALPGPARLLFRLAAGLTKAAYYDDQKIYRVLGIDYRKPRVFDEPAPWLARVQTGASLERDLDIKAEAVVVGTGAGGAVAAAVLAAHGIETVMVEEGEHYRRSAFTGRPLEMQRMMYRNFGLTGTLGNVPILVPVGCGVGGSTLVNSGTCVRTPEEALARWRREYGLSDLTRENLEPYFQRVEAAYRVTKARKRYIGKTGDAIARGASILGYKHGPLMRNAPECDGQGICVYGCPTDAKLGTQLAFVPRALSDGARLVTGTKVEKILYGKGGAEGIEGVTRSGRRVRVRAPIVVLACGTLYTPLLLMKHGIGRRSGQLGKNLSIHPACGVFAMLEEKVNGWKTIPQGYMVNEFVGEGILLEGGHLPLDTVALTTPLMGKELQEFMEDYNHLSTFGAMIRDSSRGTVRPGPAGQPLVTYNLNRGDLIKLKRGLEILMRIYLAAGARVVYPQVQGWKPVRTESDIDENMKRKVRPWDFDLSAYHPLGTCHMGIDPKRSVTDPDGQVHGTRNLFICDGSAVPPAPGVNPMITISTLAMRNAEHIVERVRAGKRK